MIKNDPDRSAGIGLPHELYHRLKNTFIQCGYLNSDQALKAVFMDSRISEWKATLPQATSVSDRIDFTIEFLWNRSNLDNKNALVLFVQVLRDRTPIGDALSNEFVTLAGKLEKVKLNEGARLDEEFKRVKSHVPPNIEQLDLVKVYPRAHMLNVTDWQELIWETKSRIDIAAEAFFELANQPSLADALRKQLNNKVMVRLLMNSPNNLNEWFADYEQPDLQVMINRIQEAEKAARIIYDSLPSESRSYFQVVQVLEGGRRFHVAIRRFDEQMYVLHYMYSLPAQDTPAYVIEGSKSRLFKIYMNEFERLWQRFYPEGLLFK